MTTALEAGPGPRDPGPFVGLEADDLLQPARSHVRFGVEGELLLSAEAGTTGAARGRGARVRLPELEAATRGLARDGDYWQLGKQWIAEERAARRRHVS